MKNLYVQDVWWTHKRHNFVIIEDFASDKRGDLNQYIGKVTNTDNPGIQGKVTATEDKIKENGKTFKQMIADIKDQAKKMKKEIDECADKLIQLCCELEKSNDEILKSYKSALKSLMNQNTRKVKVCQQILDSGINLEVIEKAKEIRGISDSLPVPGEMKTVQFNPRPILTSQLEYSLGFLTVDGQDQQYCPVTKATVVSEFKHKSGVTACRKTQDNAWLSYWNDVKIYRVDQMGNIKDEIECDVKVERITISPTTGRLWFCCYEDNTVREVMDSNTIVTRFVTDSKPGCLCVTTNHTVVVGMEGKIVMYTIDGQEVESAGARGPCRQETVVPHHMAYSTQTGDIVVSDNDNVRHGDYVASKEPGKQPYIKVMDKYLNTRFRYPNRDTPGISSISRQQSLFFPADVCFDAVGNVLVIDGVNKSVVLIDGYRGDYIRTIFSGDYAPYSISLQTDNTLWVVLSNRKVKVLEYK